jgi:hypothetical protein
MRVFAQSDDDELWTPRPVDPARMASVPWLPTPRLVSGPCPETADVWWGEPTWVAAVVNHRSCVEEFRRSVPDYWLPGASIVRTIGELESCAARTPRWVAKAPHSAAGRDRVRGDEACVAPRARSQAVRLLALYGCLLFEPWFERIEDFGAAGTVEVADVSVGAERAGGIGVSAAHRLLVDRAGRFAGIEVGVAAPGACSDAGMHVGEVLLSLEYVGAFGVDLYSTLRPDGTTQLRLSEINARHTFGHVAQALAPKARPSMGIGAADPLTLRFGRGDPPSATIPLLLPGADDDTSAWLEAPPRHAG